MALLSSTPSYPPSHHKSQLTPPEQLSPNNQRHPCLAKPAKPPAPLPTHRPPPLDPLRRLLLRLLLHRSLEQVPADRELQYLCPRTGCKTKYPQRQGRLPRLQEL
ncbi:unnamed protein product [Ectocarpus sp. 12 AP-2014]